MSHGSAADASGCLPPEAQLFRVESLLRWLPVLLLFLSYPLALVCPVRLGVPLGFQISLPSFVLLATMTTVYLALTPLRDCGVRAGVRRPRTGWKIQTTLLTQLALAGVAVLCVASAVAGETVDSRFVIEQIGYFSVPLFFAVCPRGLIPRRLILILALLWLVQILHGAWQFGVGFPVVVGLAGNPNWMATLVVALTPWFWLAVWSSRRRQAAVSAGRRAIAVRVAVAGVGTCAGLFLAYQCRCRATWLVLGIYGLVYVLLPLLSWRMRAIVGVALIALAFWVVNLASERIVETLEADIRLPLYAQTVRMTLDYPVLGVGPGNFRREFVKYRSVAHKSRFVAASVTEHPHNELLNIASSVGIPLCLAWVVLLWPLLHPPRRGGFWRTVHFSAFMLIGHSMFDKVLVQPPTNLLGFLFLGLLWRPYIRLRCAPGRRLPTVRSFVGPVLSVAAAAYALAIAYRTVRTDSLFRKASILEVNGQYGQAYETYRRSTEVSPENVRTHAFAGISANNKLRDPQLAMPHLHAAFQLDPNFAHLNGEIGLALGGSGQHEAALPFFEREVQLFPFDILGHQRLFLCRIVAGKLAGAAELHDHIATLRYRRLCQAMGEETVRLQAGNLLLAVQQDDSERAIALARDLVTSLKERTAEPAFFRLVQQADLPVDLYQHPFGRPDYAHLRRLWQLRQVARRHRGKRPDEIFAVREEAELLLANQGEVGRGGQVDTLAVSAPEYVFAELAYQCGFDVALLQTGGAGSHSNIVVLLEPVVGEHAAKDKDSPAGTTAIWLASPTENKIFRVADREAAFAVDVVRGIFGIEIDETAEPVSLLPISPLEFFSRTQALGQILSRAAVPTAPRIGESPALRLRRFQSVSAQGPGAENVRYDERLFAEFTPRQSEPASPAEARRK